MSELTYGWNLETEMRVAREGPRVLELPVAYRRRAGGDPRSRARCAARFARGCTSSRRLRASRWSRYSNARVDPGYAEHRCIPVTLSYARCSSYARLGAFRNSPMSQTTMPPILSHKHYSAGLNSPPRACCVSPSSEGPAIRRRWRLRKRRRGRCRGSLHVISLAAGRWREESDALRA